MHRDVCGLVIGSVVRHRMRISRECIVMYVVSWPTDDTTIVDD